MDDTKTYGASMKSRFFFVLTLTILVSLIAIPMPAYATTISAETAVVMDYDTGEILYDKQADKMMVPASMTKIMTAYIIFEEIEKGNLTLDTQIPIDKATASMSQNSNYPMAVPLTAGQSYSVKTLLELIMVPSASASCYAMAVYISGSEQDFVQRMNETANAIGMTAEFKNCHGAQPHYVTAKSIALLIKQFIQKYPDIINYTSLKSITFNGKTYANTNQLLTENYFYQGADGFKTGTITQAGYCLSATAIRDGRRIISVVMKSPNTQARHTDSIAILDYGFTEVAKRDIARQNTRVELSSTPIRLGADYKMTVRFDQVSDFFQSKGVFTVNGEVMKEVDLINVWDGAITDFTHYFEQYDEESVNIGFSLYLPNGSKRDWSVDIPISEEEPAVFRDINGHWAEKQIEDLYAKKVFYGGADRYFIPNDKINIAMLVTLLGRMSESEGTEIAPENISQDGKYYSKYLAWALETGIIEADLSTIDPNAQVSRQELAVVMDKFYNETELLTETASTHLLFTDQSEISEDALLSIQKLTAAGVLTGYEDNSFRPNNTVTRAEMAVILMLYSAEKT